MKQFYFTTSFLIGIILLFACTEHRYTIKKKNLTLDEVYVNKLDSVLPRSMNPKDYMIIYRYGSIEWCPYASIFCINKKDLNQKRLNVAYYMCNFDMDGETIKNKPTLSMYRLKIENPDLNANKLNMSKLTKMTFTKLNKYVRNMYLNTKIGEGYCSNLYLIKSQESNSIYLLNKDHSTRMANYLKLILRKISPVEYYQSLSLEKGCGTPTDLGSIFRLGKDLDTFDFVLRDNYSNYGN
jgi:hypothetical protein